MASPTDLMNQVLQNQQATEMLQQQPASVQMGLDRGNTSVTDNQMLVDADSLSPFEFSQKYGEQARQLQQNMHLGIRDTQIMDSDRREGIQQAGDIANTIATGAIGGLGDVAALGTGLMTGGKGGHLISQGTEAFREGMRSLRSETSQDASILQSMRSALDREDNQQQYDKDIAEGQSELVATLSQIGRGVVAGASGIVEDPTSFENALGEGVGSLLVGGPISKGVTATTGVIAKLAQYGKQVVQGTSGKAAGRTWGDVASMPTAIALQESGAVYSQNMNEVMGMTHDELMRSPEYAAMIENDVPQEEAKLAIAQDAGLAGALVMAPIAMAGGKLAASFEAAPLAAPSVRGMMSNILRETAEEGIQGGAGEASANYGIQTYADPSRSIAEGVGESVGEGAVLGSAIAGSLQAPAATGLPVQAALDNLRQSVEAREAEAQASNPTSTANFEKTVAEAAPVAQEAMANIQAKAAERVGEPEVGTETGDVDPVDVTAEVNLVDAPAAPDVDTFFAALDDTILFKPEKARGKWSTSTEDLIINGLGRMGVQQPNAVQIMTVSEALMNDSNLPEENRLELAAYLVADVEDRYNFYTKDVPSFISANPEYEEDLSGVTPLIEQMQRLRQHPAYVKAQDMLKDVDSTTPMSSAAALSLAQVAPEKVNPDQLETLYQDMDNPNYDDNDRRAIQSARTLHLLAQEAKQTEFEEESDVNSNAEDEDGPRVENLGIPDPKSKDYSTELAEAVTINLTLGGEGSASDRKSMSQFYTDINADIRKGNQLSARRKLEHVARMVEHMANKVQAMNESYESGNSANYESLGTWGNWFGEGTLKAHMNKANSTALARRMSREAEFVHKVYDSLRELHPELNGRDLDIDYQLHPAFYGLNADDLIESSAQNQIGVDTKGASEKPKAKKRKVPKRVRAYKVPKTLKFRIKPNAEVQAIPKPKDPRPMRLKEAVIRLGGFLIGDGNGEIEALDYKRPGFRKKTKRVSSSAGHNGGGLELDTMREALIERGYLPEDATINDMIDALRDDIAGTVRYSTQDEYIAAEWDAYDQAVEWVLENPSQGELDLQPTEESAGDRIDPQVIEDEKVEKEAKAARRKAEEAEAEVEPEEVRTVEGDFPKLRKLGDTSPFAVAYRYATKKVSRLVGSTDPFNDAYRAFIGKDEKGLFTDAKPLKGVNTDNIQALKGYIREGRNIWDEMHSRLRSPAVLAKNAQTPDRNKYAEGMILNLTEGDGKTIKYNRPLVEAGILAALDWVQNIRTKTYEMNAEEVAKSYGISEEMAQANLAFFNNGISAFEAKDELANHIKKFWGVQDNNQAPALFTQGIAESLAAEIISVMSQELSDPLLKRISEPVGGQTYVRFTTRDLSQDRQAQSEALGGTKTALSTLVLAEPVMQGWKIGEPSGYMPTTQIRNPMSAITRKQKSAVKNQMNRAYGVNPHTANFFKSVSDSALLLAAGIPERDDSHYNKAHKKSVDGERTTLLQSVRNVRDMLKEADVYSQIEGKPAKFYFDFGVTLVGRMMMLGSGNPQSNKIGREVFMPNKSELDLSWVETDEGYAPNDPEAHWGFWKTIAQGLGFKTELKDGTETQVDAEALLQGKLADVVQGFMDWIDGGEVGNVDHLVTDFAAAMGGDYSFHGLQSVIAYARYRHAIENDADLTKFDHWNYLEADGKTNGPMNAIVKFAAGTFTSAWVRTVGKGGLYFTGEPKRMSQATTEEKVDLYQAGADNMAKFVKELRSQLGKKEDLHFERLGRVFTALGLSVEYKDGELTVKRKFTKNPLTVSVYGSGLNGIVGKVTKIMEDALYEHMSQTLVAMDTDPTIRFGDLLLDGRSDYTREAFWSDLSSLLTMNVTFSKKKGFNVFGNVNRRMPLHFNNENAHRDFLRDFEISKKDSQVGLAYSDSEYAYLSSAIKHFLVAPMKKGIDASVFDHVSGTTQQMLIISKIQAVIAKAQFSVMYRKKILEKEAADPTYDRRMGLSKKDVNEIYAELKNVIGSYETGEQNIFVGTTSKATLFGTASANGKNLTLPRRYSTDVKGQLKTDVYFTGPSDVGVGIIPNMTISSGDGGMVLDHFAAPDTEQDAVQVYDGVNFRADRLRIAGQQINKSVLHTWTRNELRAILESFQRTLRSDIKALENDLDAFGDTNSELLRMELEEAIFGPESEEYLRIDQLIEVAKDIEVKFADTVQQVDDRQEVLRRVSLSVDQMGGTESPYFQEGKVIIPTGSTPEQVAAILRDELSKVKAERAKRKFGPRALGLPQVPTKVAGVTQSMVDNRLVKFLRDNAKKFPKNHASLAQKAVAYLAKQKYRILFGSNEALETYIQKNHSERYDSKKGSYLGKFEPTLKRIFIANATTETFTHELLHAATWDKLTAYYNKGDLPELDREAIKRLEALTEDFLKLDLGVEFSSASSAITGHWSRGDKRAAVSEFIAYGLTDSALSHVLSKTKVMSPLARMRKAAREAILKLFGAKEAPFVGEDILSNLRFNTEALLMSEAIPTQNIGAAMTMFHEAEGDPRLTEIEHKLVDLTRKLLANKDPIKADLMKVQLDEAILKSTELSDEIEAAGFEMTNQQRAVYRMMVTALAVDVDMNPTTLSRLQDYYSHVADNITPETFVPYSSTTLEAERKYKAVVDLFQKEKDRKGRSYLMPSFLGLALTHPDFRTILEQMDKPKEFVKSKENFDTLLSTYGKNIVDKVSNWATGERKADTTAGAAIDTLTNRLLQEQEIALTAGENLVTDLTNQVNDFFIEQGNKLYDKGQKSTNAHVRNLTRVFSKTGTDLIAESVITLSNSPKAPNIVRAAVTEIVGRTDSNKFVFDLISKTKATVDRIRQNIREKLPKNLKDQFSRPLRTEETEAMFYGLGKSDLASLALSDGLDDAIRVVTDSKYRTKELTRLMEDLTPRQQEYVKRLASHMITGKATDDLLTNAYLISRIAGGSEAHIDRVTTLAAYELLSAEQKYLLETLAKEEAKGFKSTLATLAGIRRDEDSKVAESPRGRANAIKGFLRDLPQEGVHIKIASTADHSRLIKQGYTLIHDYVGDPTDSLAPAMAYYHAPVNGQAKFNQGLMLTTQVSQFGVDPNTGFSNTGTTAGRITDPEDVAQIEYQKSARRKPNDTTEPLRAIYDGKTFQVIGYERMIDPDKMVGIAVNRNLLEVMGAWRGRQMEEQLSEEMNLNMLAQVDAMYQSGRKDGKASDYINLMDGKNLKDNRVLRDAMELMPAYLRKAIENTYDGKFMVRRDMVDDVVGFRGASVGDFWTGNTYWSKETQKTIQDLAVSIFGNSAFNKFVNAERFIQENVLDAKLMIVVKSAIVPIGNLISNAVQAASLGIPLRTMLKGFKDKTVELNAYIKRENERLNLEQELLAARGQQDVESIKRINIKLQTIQDSYKRMSIWPLIEAGEFSAISEGGGSVEDMALAEGKYGSLVESIAAKLPDGLRTPYRYLMITKDTPLFQAMAAATQYGDFVAKAVVYDHMTKTEGMSQKEAIGFVSEEFVNYNRTVGRTRTYLEKTGLIWFWNFKVRSMKVAARTMQRNPFRAMLYSMSVPSLPLVGQVGTVLHDNLASIMAQGRIGNSIGLGNAFSAYEMNPWVSAWDHLK